MRRRRLGPIVDTAMSRLPLKMASTPPTEQQSEVRKAGEGEFCGTGRAGRSRIDRAVEEGDGQGGRGDCAVARGAVDEGPTGDFGLAQSAGRVTLPRMFATARDDWVAPVGTVSVSWRSALGSLQARRKVNVTGEAAGAVICLVNSPV